MNKQEFNKDVFKEIISRYDIIKSIIENILISTKKENNYGSSSLDIEYITNEMSYGIGIYFKSGYILKISFLKETEGWTFHMREPNIVYPEALDVLQKVSEKILNYNKEYNSYGFYTLNRIDD